MSTPWDVYAKELGDACRLGYPLWDPEPEEQGTVCIGDVGYISEGRFRRLFNATRPANDALNALFGVPDGYEPLQIKEPLFEDKEPRMLRVGKSLNSNSITSTQVSGGASGKGIGGSIHFKCSEDRGAILALPRQTLLQQKLRKNKTLAGWMLKYHKTWYRWATETHDLDLKEEEIIFVTGWVKTEEWAVGAFVDRGHVAHLELNIGAGPVAGASFSVTTTSSTSRAWHQRSGPCARQADGLGVQDAHASGDQHELLGGQWHGRDGGASQKSRKGRTENRGKRGNRNNEAGHVHDQCVFLHYTGFKERTGILPRFLPKRLKAAADGEDASLTSDDDEDDDDDVGMAGYSLVEDTSLEDAYEIENMPLIPERYDPVNCLMEYILDHSDAAYASADTEDVAFIQKIALGEDLTDILDRIRPAVIVDRSGLGILDIVSVQQDLPRQGERTGAREDTPDPTDGQSLHDPGEVHASTTSCSDRTLVNVQHPRSYQSSRQEWRTPHMSESWTQTWDPPDKHNVIAAVAKDDLDADSIIVGTPMAGPSDHVHPNQSFNDHVRNPQKRMTMAEAATRGSVKRRRSNSINSNVTYLVADIREVCAPKRARPKRWCPVRVEHDKFEDVSIMTHNTQPYAAGSRKNINPRIVQSFLASADAGAQHLAIDNWAAETTTHSTSTYRPCRETRILPLINNFSGSLHEATTIDSTTYEHGIIGSRGGDPRQNHLKVDWLGLTAVFDTCHSGTYLVQTQDINNRAPRAKRPSATRGNIRGHSKPHPHTRALDCRERRFFPGDSYRIPPQAEPRCALSMQKCTAKPPQTDAVLGSEHCMSHPDLMLPLGDCESDIIDILMSSDENDTSATIYGCRNGIRAH